MTSNGCCSGVCRGFEGVMREYELNLMRNAAWRLATRWRGFRFSTSATYGRFTAVPNHKRFQPFVPGEGSKTSPQSFQQAFHLGNDTMSDQTGLRDEIIKVEQLAGIVVPTSHLPLTWIYKTRIASINFCVAGHLQCCQHSTVVAAERNCNCLNLRRKNILQDSLRAINLHVERAAIEVRPMYVVDPVAADLEAHFKELPDILFRKVTGLCQSTSTRKKTRRNSVLRENRSGYLQIAPISIVEGCV